VPLGHDYSEQLKNPPSKPESPIPSDDSKATIPPDNPIARHTTNSHAMRQSTGLQGVDDQMPDDKSEPEQRRSQRKRTSKYGDQTEKGFYRKLNRGQLDKQDRKLGNYFCDYLTDERFTNLIQYALTAVKVDHDLQTIHTTVPKNLRQARRDPDYLTKWYPAMVKQYKSLTDKETYILVPFENSIDILPGKWVYDQKLDPDTGIWIPERDG